MDAHGHITAWKDWKYDGKEVAEDRDSEFNQKQVKEPALSKKSKRPSEYIARASPRTT